MILCYLFLQDTLATSVLANIMPNLAHQHNTLTYSCKQAISPPGYIKVFTTGYIRMSTLENLLTFYTPFFLILTYRFLLSLTSHTLVLQHYIRTVECSKRDRVGTFTMSSLQVNSNFLRLETPPSDHTIPFPSAPRTIVSKTTMANRKGTHQDDPRPPKSGDKHTTCELIGEIKV
jgi:hypothetical protein